MLTAAIEAVVNTTAWEIDRFACADGWDEEKKRYRGLKAAKPVGPIGPVGPDPDPRRGTGLQGPGGPDGPTQPEPTPKMITRFHGTVAIDPLRAGTIAREVIKHLSGLVGVKVQLTMEIQAESPEGIPEERQRSVNENCRTLKFQSFRFEEE